MYITSHAHAIACYPPTNAQLPPQAAEENSEFSSPSKFLLHDVQYPLHQSKSAVLILFTPTSFSSFL